MNRTVAAMLGSLLILGGLLLLLREPPARSGPSAGPAGVPGDAPTGDEKASVHLLCAASNRAVVDAIARDYEKECGIAVEVQYGPSQTLLSSAEVSRTGDLYLPADDSYLALAREKQLVEEIIPLARMQAVVAVAKGNPKGITSFDDLLQEGVRVVQAGPDAAAIGKMTRDVLTAAGLWERLDRQTAAYRTTVNDVANDVKVGAADAGIVFDAVLATYPEIESVALPELGPVAANVGVGVLASTRQPRRALHFARYLAARDRGQLRYREFRFQPVDGDAWADEPDLTLYSGSMLRPAIEETLKAFEEREGVKVTRVYNGCGILVAQMRAGQHPDAYFACDSEFMLQVHDLFQRAAAISENELVILVHKGNPHAIASLKDLTKPGLRVGIGHEKQCAMGWLTQRTLTEAGLTTGVMPNVTVQSPTGDMLVNQLRTGSLDAAIVYISNAAGAGDAFDALRIENIPCSKATQPYAVAEDSRHGQLAGRLFERLVSAESRARFEQWGFRWQGGVGAGNGR
jgi:molybdenum ABC transporter molybdate-binding protein